MTQGQAEEILGGVLRSGRLSDMEDDALAILLGYADADAEPEDSKEGT